MPRKKNYIVRRGITSSVVATESSRSQPTTTANQGLEVDIDMLELLGPHVRLTSYHRVLLLRAHLGRGIDEWVFSTKAAIEKNLLGGIETSTAIAHHTGILSFFDFLTEGRALEGLSRSKPATPVDLKPLHITQFIGWLRKRAHEASWGASTTRMKYSSVKQVLLSMFRLGLIPGDPLKFFPRRPLEREDREAKTTGLSDAEQGRLAAALKSDLSAIHHGRLKLPMSAVQALRLLLVAHRMGHNLTPLLELERDSVKPGLLPGTVLIQTKKTRNRKVISQMGAAGSEVNSENLGFGLAEGAVIAQAIASTQNLAARASPILRNRVWLFEIAKSGRSRVPGDVSVLSPLLLWRAIASMVQRHALKGDDGLPLVVTTARLRRSRWDRTFRITGGDVAATANLLGHTSSVSSANYPSMNLGRQAEAAHFLNEDYIGMMLDGEVASPGGSRGKTPMRLVKLRPVARVDTSTPIAGCSDALNGERAPKNGRPCDRFIMCLFCSSFAVVGSVEELWKLFSFQAFARAELAYLDERLGPVLDAADTHPQVAELHELRDRYRLVIPFVDSFAVKQFPRLVVQRARDALVSGLHPFWVLQMELSRNARQHELVWQRPT